jgi:nucleoside-diphosphate-sugar epimerase
MKVLFIGGTGNISTSVSQLCISKGIDLWLLNRQGTQSIVEARSLRCDIKGPDAKAQLANHEWDVVVNWIAFAPADIERDIALFASKARQYIFISSASCYNNPNPAELITERTPLANPHWEYSRNKIACEQRLQRAYREQRFPYTIVRPSHTYRSIIPLSIGSGSEYTVVDRMKKGLPVIVQDDGESLWTLTHADDFAKGFVGLMGNPKALQEDFQITSDETLSWNEIYRLTAKALNCEAKIVHVSSQRICEKDSDYIGSLLGDKAVSSRFDNSKVKRLVPEFVCTIPFAEGIKQAIQLFESEPVRQRIDPETNALIDELIAGA